MWHRVDILERVKKISEIEEQLEKFKRERDRLLSRAKQLEDHTEVRRIVRRPSSWPINPSDPFGDGWVINPMNPVRRHSTSGRSNEISPERRSELIKKYREKADYLTEYKIKPLEKYLEQLKEMAADGAGIPTGELEQNDELSHVSDAINEGYPIWQQRKFDGARTIAGNMVRKYFQDVKEFEEGKTKFGRKLQTEVFKKLRERIRKGIERRRPQTKARRKGRKP